MKRPELIQLMLLIAAPLFSFTISLSKSRKVESDKIITSTDSTVRAFELKVRMGSKNRELTMV